MKLDEIRNMTSDELKQKTLSLKEELAQLLFQKKTSNVEKPSRISLIKKDIARIKTILKEGSYAK